MTGRGAQPALLPILSDPVHATARSGEQTRSSDGPACQPSPIPMPSSSHVWTERGVTQDASRRPLPAATTLPSWSGPANNRSTPIRAGNVGIENPLRRCGQPAVWTWRLLGLSGSSIRSAPLRDVRRVLMGKNPHRQAARGVPDQHVRPGYRALQQRVQLLSEALGSARQWTRLAVAHARAIVGADPCGLGRPWLHPTAP